MDIKFIYFDLGGVLFYWKRVISDLAELLETDIESVNEAFVKYDPKCCLGEISPDELWQLYCKHFDYSSPDNFNFLDFWVSDFKPIPEMHNFTKNLINEGYSIGVLTNIYNGTYEKLLSSSLIPNLNYSVVIKSFEHHLAKPDSKIYNLATNKSEVKPEEILFIDDTQENIDAALKQGWQALHFDNSNINKSLDLIKSTIR